LGQESHILYRVVLSPLSASLLPSYAAYFLSFILALVSLGSVAEKNVDLYSVSVLVVNQNPEVRQKAAAKGLNRVLIRLSGQRDIAQTPQITAALRVAPDYLDRFSYQSTNQTLTIAGAEQRATLLVMQFNSVSVKRLLTESGSSIWTERRPDLLVWTATDIRGKKYVDIESSMAKALNTASSDRGLPLVLPVLDLEDREALPVARLWALDENQIRLASKRYGTNAVLSGRFTRQRNAWSGSFILMHKGKNTYLNAKGRDETAVAAAIINQVSDYFASLYAVNFKPNRDAAQFNSSSVTDNASPTLNPSFVRNRGPRSLYLQVNNVGDFATYVVVVNYLETLALVSSVRIANAGRQQLLLDIELAVDKDQFFSAVELDNRLRRVVQNNSGSFKRDSVFEFTWR